jgi:hypothetical protein
LTRLARPHSASSLWGCVIRRSIVTFAAAARAGMVMGEIAFRDKSKDERFEGGTSLMSNPKNEQRNGDNSKNLKSCPLGYLVFERCGYGTSLRIRTQLA